MAHSATRKLYGAYFAKGASGEPMLVTPKKRKLPDLFHLVSAGKLTSIAKSGLRPQRPEDASIILGESTKSVSFSPDPDRALDAIGDMWRGNSAAVLKLRSSAIKKHRIYDIAGMTYGGDASDFAITQEHRIFETIAPEDLEVAGVVDLSGLSYGDIKLVLKGMKPKPLSAYRKGKRGGLFKKTKSGKRTYKKKGGK